MRIFILFLVVCLSLPGSVHAITVVENSKPNAVVLLRETASEQLQEAARTLVFCVQKATGSTLSIVHERQAGANAICIGPPPLGLNKPSQSGLDDDGFEILFPDLSTIHIIGPTDWGTEFGVYEFLERFVGVRWLLPSDCGVDIPRCATLAIPEVPVREEPVFISRLFSGLRGSEQAVWARRNRMHGRISFHHNLIKLFPPEDYTTSHPGFFPIKKGERFLPKTNSTHGWQPCFTAEGLTEEAIANIRKTFDKNPVMTSFSLGANDSSGYCECEACRTRISGEKNFLGRTDYSDLYYAWANSVIKGVLETHPDKYFGCLAYSEVAAPPKNVSVHERLIPYMTYDRMKWIDPELRETGEALTKAWHEKSPTLGWYDYIYGTPYLLPRVWFHHMADYYRFGRDNGVRALYAEAYPNWGEGPKLYVSLKLQWNPDLDVDALLDEWYTRCAGPEAAPFLAKYYAHWEDFWTRRVLESAWFSKGGQYLAFSRPHYLRDIELDEIDQSRTWLEEAVRRTKTPEQAERVGLLLRAFEYYETSAYAYRTDDEVSARETAMDAPAFVEIMRNAEKAAAYSRKRDKLVFEEFAHHPVLVHPLDSKRFKALDGAGWATNIVWHGYDLAAAGNGAVLEAVDKLAHRDDSAAALQAQLMLSLLNNDRECILKNGSFEDGTGNAADNWTWWVKWGVGKMLRSEDVAHTGTASLLCDGMRRGGPVQVLPITPGKYGLVCFVYVPLNQTSQGTVELSMTLRNAADKNLPSLSSMLVPTPGKWTALAVGQDVPEMVGDEKVSRILPIVIVDGFGTDDRVYIDDIGLYRLDAK